MTEQKVLSIDETVEEVAKMAKESLDNKEKVEEETVTISKTEFNEALQAIKASNEALLKSGEEKIELNNKYLRALADYQNLKRISDIKVANAKDSGKASVFKELIQIIDNFEKAIEADEVTEGVKLIYNGILSVLKNNNVEIINPAVGDEFDDTIHEAVAPVPGNEENKNKISFVQFKGYKMGEIILRYAKVGVYV